MSDIAWPQTLPLPTVQGYSIQPGDTILRTEMDSGLARQRRRFTNAPTRLSVSWVMKRNQFAVFEAWYKFYAKEGGAFFNIELLGGIGLVTHNARFTKQFNAYLKNNFWHVNSELEIRERPTLSEDSLALLMDSNIDNLLNKINGLHDVVHFGKLIKDR